MTNKKKSKIIILGGPTASGKSALGLRLAQRFGGEIIGADSMQIYKGMDIGTGKIKPEAMQGIRHRMIDIVEPGHSYSAGQYCLDAQKEIDEVIKNGSLPIIVGGTGLYINALINSYNFAGVKSDEDYRNELRQKAQQLGIESLHAELAEADPQAAQKISPSDLKKIIRALEICKLGGGAKSSLVCGGEESYDYLMFVIKTDRAALYLNIERRVDEMFDEGLLEEVESLNADPEWQSIKAIGYKETLKYLNNEITMTELAELIKKNTRHYAKRQITYFKNIFPKAVWVDADDFEFITAAVAEFLS